jgi:hypothetical protein
MYRDGDFKRYIKENISEGKSPYYVSKLLLASFSHLFFGRLGYAYLSVKAALHDLELGLCWDYLPSFIQDWSAAFNGSLQVVMPWSSQAFFCSGVYRPPWPPRLVSP